MVIVTLWAARLHILVARITPASKREIRNVLQSIAALDTRLTMLQHAGETAKISMDASKVVDTIKGESEVRNHDDDLAAGKLSAEFGSGNQDGTGTEEAITTSVVASSLVISPIPGNDRHSLWPTVLIKMHKMDKHIALVRKVECNAIQQDRTKRSLRLILGTKNDFCWCLVVKNGGEKAERIPEPIGLMSIQNGKLLLGVILLVAATVGSGSASPARGRRRWRGGRRRGVG